MKPRYAIIVFILSGATFIVLGLTHLKVQKVQELSREIGQLDTAIERDLNELREGLLEIVPAEERDSLSSALPIGDKELRASNNNAWEDAYLDVRMESNEGAAFFLYAPGVFKNEIQAKKFAVFFSTSLIGTNEENLRIKQLAELKIHTPLRRQVPRQYNYVYVASPANRDSLQFFLKYLPDNWGLIDKIPDLFTDARYTARDTAYTRLFLQSFGKIGASKAQRQKALLRNIMIDDIRGLSY